MLVDPRLIHLYSYYRDAELRGATLLLKNKLTGLYAAMFFIVEDKAPFKIRSIGNRLDGSRG